MPEIYPRGLGFEPSPSDYRDMFGAAAAVSLLKQVSVPESFLVDFSRFGVFDQQQQLSCVSNAIALKLKQYFYKKLGVVIPFSPRWGDVMSKRFDGFGMGTDRLTTGTYARIALKVAAKYGWATEATVPNATNLSISEYRNDAIITPQALAEASKYKIPGYIRIPDDLTLLRAATRVYDGIPFATAVGPEMYTAADGRFSFAGADISPIRTPKKIIGSHQMVLSGWDKNFDREVNSWGAGWGYNGQAFFDAQAWDPFLIEAWAIADIPKDISLLLASLPAPADFHYRWDKNMQLGDESEDVKFLQIAYMILGHLEHIPAEQLGIFGRKTAAANAKYQTTKGIKPTVPYSAGPLTRAFLNSDFSIE